MGKESVELHSVRMIINGEVIEAQVEPRLLLTDFLRHHLGLTGTHVGCEHGVCGACTILVDGDSMRSCLMLTVCADGREIQTVESFAKDDELSDIQQAFHEHHGLQCGFCTPGMLATCIDAMSKYPMDTEEQKRQMLSGNLCRCTGYQGIVNAVKECAQLRAREEKL